MTTRKLLKRSSLEDSSSSLADSQSKNGSNPLKRSVILSSEKTQLCTALILQETNSNNQSDRLSSSSQTSEPHLQLLNLTAMKSNMENPFLRARLQFVLRSGKEKESHSTADELDEFGFEDGMTTLKLVRQREGVQKKQAIRCLTDRINGR